MSKPIEWDGSSDIPPGVGPFDQINPIYRGPYDPAKGIRITCGPARRLDWSHDGGPDDIVAYRIIYKSDREPSHD